MGTEYVVVSSTETESVIGEGAKGPPGASWNRFISPAFVDTFAYTVTEEDDYVGVDYPGVVNISLTSIHNKIVTIKDEGGHASLYNITITPTSGLIEGEPDAKITYNYTALTFVCRNGNWFII